MTFPARVAASRAGSPSTMRGLLHDLWTTDRHDDLLRGLALGCLAGSAPLLLAGWLLRRL